jgi:hypothetical protein
LERSDLYRWDLWRSDPYRVDPAAARVSDLETFCWSRFQIGGIHSARGMPRRVNMESRVGETAVGVRAMVDDRRPARGEVCPCLAARLAPLVALVLFRWSLYLERRSMILRRLTSNPAADDGGFQIPAKMAASHKTARTSARILSGYRRPVRAPFKRPGDLSGGGDMT